jgi:hypothetical protein
MYRTPQVFRCPSGWYWRSADGKVLHGPYKSRQAAHKAASEAGALAAGAV